MKRPVVLAGGLVVVGIGALALTRVDKLAQTFFVRATAPRESTAGGRPGPRPQYRVDFSGGAAPDNLFWAKATNHEETFFQDKQPHRLTLENLTPAPFFIDTNDTFIDYKKGALVWLTVYLAPDTVSFRDSVRIVAATLGRIGLGERFDAREYDRHMGDVVDQEIWAPELVLARARVTPQLNCGWQWHQPAREQIDRVACRPLLSITVPFDGGVPPSTPPSTPPPPAHPG